MTVRYRGGAEAYYEIKARGRTFRVPGVLCIHDVMKDIVGSHAQGVRAAERFWAAHPNAGD